MGESARIIPSKIFDILSERTSGFVRWKCAVISFASESGRTFIHSAGGNSINFELFAGISIVSNFLKSPLPSDFNSSTFSGVGDLWSSTNSLFLNPPASIGSESVPALTSSRRNTLPLPISGPSASISDSFTNQRLEFEFIGEIFSPFKLRLFKNSFWAESSQPKTIAPCHLQKSPMTFK